jgi:hypothetical protein
MSTPLVAPWFERARVGSTKHYACRALLFRSKIQEGCRTLLQ